MLWTLVSAADMPTAARDASIVGIEQALAEGQYTVTDLVRYYVARIGAIDQHGPALHSIIEINPDWPRLSRDLDRSDRPAREPLFGVPVVLKENIDTADHMHTTAGSFALLDSSPQRDAFMAPR